MSKKRKENLTKKQIIALIISAIILLTIDYFFPEVKEVIKSVNEQLIEKQEVLNSYDIGNIPEYNGEPYVIINNNKPYFTEDEYITKSFENYSELDSLGRCGVTYANVCRATMPPKGDERGDISSVKPSGWIQKMYNGEALYNRCHLIGYQLTDEDANEKNLITGTRYFNVNGMLPFENQVAEYIKYQKKNENKHVLYRVTPIFKERNLVASGVEMEAYSVEDGGQGVCFNVFVYNVQPGISINYETGESKRE